MRSAPEILIDVSRRLNERIRGLDAALASGAPTAAGAEEIRRGATEDLVRLRAAEGGTGAVGATIPKVIEHLELFAEIAGAADASPGLTRKLLRHLLDEQLELTALVEREAASGTGGARPGIGREGPRFRPEESGSHPPSGPRPDEGGAPDALPALPSPEAGPRPAGPATESPSRPAATGAGLLPGGRRPLTVGSLIGR